MGGWGPFFDEDSSRQGYFVGICHEIAGLWRERNNMESDSGSDPCLRYRSRERDRSHLCRIGTERRAGDQRETSTLMQSTESTTGRWAYRDGVDLWTTRGPPCLVRTIDHSCGRESVAVKSAWIQLEMWHIDLTLGPAGPSRTAQTAVPQTIQLVHLQV